MSFFKLKRGRQQLDRIETMLLKRLEIPMLTIEVEQTRQRATDLNCARTEGTTQEIRKAVDEWEAAFAEYQNAQFSLNLARRILENLEGKP